MTKKSTNLLIIDGNALLHRAWHALPPLTAPDGTVVNAVYGFLSVLFKVFKDLAPSHVAVTFDRKGPTFRHAAYAEYKATRVKQPDELYAQIPLLKEVLAVMRIPVLEAEGFEADDVIATLVKKTERDEIAATILTGDMDTLQLVDNRTRVLGFKRGISDTVFYDAAEVQKRFGLGPDQMVDYKALRGDPSDNIPGVRGIGEKTATELLQKFGSVAGILKELDKKTPDIRPAVAEKLRAGGKDLKEAQDLVLLRRDAPIQFRLDDAALQPLSREDLTPTFSKLGFMTLLQRIPHLYPPPSRKGEETEGFPPSAKRGEVRWGVKFIDDDKELSSFVASLKTVDSIALHPALRNPDSFGGDFFGLAIATTERVAFVSLDDKRRLGALRPLLEDDKIEKVAHDAKQLIEALRTHGIGLRGLAMDTMIASYLLSPGTRTHDLERLVFERYGRELAPTESPQGKLLPPTAQEVAPLYTERAGYVLRLAGDLGRELKEKTHDRLFREIELPLIPVLATMEQNGVLVDVSFLKKMSGTLTRRLESLAKTIYKLAGEEFNINSPLQLKAVLFDKLRIPAEGVRRTAGGAEHSTAASELEKLRGLHPIVEHIFEHRELQKLLTTYVDALPAIVNSKTGRVHTTFNQAVAATGRLSSSNPNLQNIPVRTELGREIRKAFVADRGNVLVAADYAQIELRLAALIADDENMLAAFRKNEDIHTHTAASIWGIPHGQVTKDQRRAAKAINFGILYGQGPHGLSGSAGISYAEAKDFIDRYFASHPAIKNYLETTKALAASQGYVETIFGRKRYLPEIKSGIPAVRAAAERAAINMPIQGTSADLIKLAMIATHDELAKRHPDAKLILQVHDELIVECPNDQAQGVGRLMKTIMESVRKFKIPIVVDVESGSSWGDLAPVMK